MICVLIHFHLFCPFDTFFPILTHIFSVNDTLIIILMMSPDKSVRCVRHVFSTLDVIFGKGNEGLITLYLVEKGL